MFQDLPQEVLHARAGHGRLILPLRPELQARRAAREDEVEDVFDLLVAHADASAGSAEDIARVALTVAVACLGEQHLWQDLGLGSRVELSALMRRWFPILVARNERDMKWKKFLYRQLCEREQVLICKSPSCAECGDFAVCFGPELA